MTADPSRLTLAAPIDCEGAETLTLDRAADAGSLSFARQAQLDRHLAACAACAEFAEDIGEVESELTDLFGAVARGDLAGSPEARFLEELPGLDLPRLAGQRRRSRARRWAMPFGGLAAAAALLFAFGPSLGLWGAPTPHSLGGQATVAMTASPSPATAEVANADAKLELALADVFAGF